MKLFQSLTASLFRATKLFSYQTIFHNISRFSEGWSKQSIKHKPSVSPGIKSVPGIQLLLHSKLKLQCQRNMLFWRLYLNFSASVVFICSWPSFQGFFSAIELLSKPQILHLLKSKVRTISKVTRKTAVDENQTNMVLDILHHAGEDTPCNANAMSYGLCVSLHTLKDTVLYRSEN